jgi:hypothetical protein
MYLAQFSSARYAKRWFQSPHEDSFFSDRHGRAEKGAAQLRFNPLTRIRSSLTELTRVRCFFNMIWHSFPLQGMQKDGFNPLTRIRSSLTAQFLWDAGR